MTGAGTSRRTLLRAAAGPVLLRAAGPVTVATPLVAGCARGPRRSGAVVEVFVVWSGAELSTFREAMSDFTCASGREVRIVPIGEQVNEFLRARIDAGNPPDVAVVPLPGLVTQYAREKHARALPPSLGDNFPAGWRDMVSVDGKLYGLWIKAAHKSLFWYRPSMLDGQQPPRTWPELVCLVRRSARAGRPPLSVGAADGWVVTDWFENALVGAGGGDVYERLARGREDKDWNPQDWDADVVAEALTRLAEVWAVPGAFPGGATRALLTQYEESVVEVFANHRAGMVFEGDFVATVVERFRQKGRVPEPPGVFRFPALTDQGQPPLVVGGDVATRMTDSEGSKELIEWLATPSALQPWIELGGFLSPNTAVPLDRYPTRNRARDLAAQLRGTGKIHFDLSDQLGGRLGGGQGRGMWRILQEFFAAVARSGEDPRTVATAVERAQGQLVDAARRS